MEKNQKIFLLFIPIGVIIGLIGVFGYTIYRPYPPPVPLISQYGSLETLFLFIGGIGVFIEVIAVFGLLFTLMQSQNNK